MRLDLLGLLTCSLKPPVIFGLISVLLLSSGCTANKLESRSRSNGQITSSQSDEATLHIAVIPARAPAEQEKSMKALADYLSKTVGRPVSFQIAQNYDAAVDWLVKEEVEIAYLGPLTYVKAHARNSQLEPIVAPIDMLTGRPWYTSVILANTASGISTLTDLKGKRFSFVSPSSTSGYLVPSAQLLKLGLNSQHDFAEVNYAGSHDKAITVLVSGAVDAVAVDKAVYLRVQKEGKLPSNTYKVLWESDPIPTPPIVVSKNLPSQLVTDLKKAFINAPDGMLDVAGAQSAGYTLVGDTDYESIRQLQTSLESKLNQAQ
jgi:phosphonate transport system substrate-binding protein